MKIDISQVFSSPADKLFYKNSTQRKLNNDEKKRLSKLVVIFNKLISGGVVQNRQLKNWLTDSEFETIQINWEREIQLRIVNYGEKPDVLIEYESKLNEGLFAYNRGESYSSKGNHASAKKLFNRADKIFEDALEHLEEQVGVDGGLTRWLDREFDLKRISTCPAGMPRLITSRSLENQSKIGKVSIRDCKIYALRLAIARLVYEDKSTQSHSNNSKLAIILNDSDEDY